MAELLITAGATALACSSVLSSFYDNPFSSSSSAAQGGGWLSNSASTQVIRRHYPPGALPPNLHQYVINPSSNSSSYSANSLFDDQPSAPPPSNTPLEVIRNDDGVRITHGGSSASSSPSEQTQASPYFPPQGQDSFPFGTSSSMTSWSSSGNYGDQRNGFPSTPPFGLTNPFFNSLPTPFSPFSGLGGVPQLNGAAAPTEGTQTVVVQNPDGSYTATQTTVHRSSGGNNASKPEYNMRHMLYFYGLIPSMAMWRTHKVWTKNEAFLTNEFIPIWTRSNFLGSRVVLQTVYATCISWQIYCLLSQRCAPSPSSSFGAPATPLDVLSAPAALGAISQAQRLSLFDHGPHSTAFGSGVGANNNGLPVKDFFSSASEEMNSLAWSMVIWPTFVFVGTSLITIPFGIIGARLGLVIRSSRGFGSLSNLGKLK